MKLQTTGRRLVAGLGIRKILNYNLLLPLGANFYDQAGKSSTRVLDFDLEGALGHGYRAIASYGFADPRYDDFKSSATGANLRGNRLPQAPKHVGRVWLTKTWRPRENSTLSASLGGRYVRHYFTNSANTIIIPSRVTFDGALTFGRPRWDVGVNAENILDKRRYFVSQINSGNQLYPGRPFNAFVTMHYRF
jgi:iron complex outermembrane receptor protein